MERSWNLSRGREASPLAPRLRIWVAGPPQAPPREAPAFLFWLWLSGILPAQAQLARALTMPSQRAQPWVGPRCKFSQTFLGKKEGRRVTAVRSCGFESLPPEFSCLQGVEELREAFHI